MTSGQETPLVSIFMFVRNGAASLRRALDSVRAQTYRNIEFIVQDGASTDGTLELLQNYGSVIQLVSEPDSGPSEGLWRALNRCTGDFIGSCLADEELLPDAVERAVGFLQGNPDVGAITGDAILTDLSGTKTGFWKSGPFNFVDYLLCDYTPYFVSSFFRRQSLLEAGLKSEEWGTDCIEFELWCRLAACSRVMYVPATLAKYASHPGQSSSKPDDALRHFTARLNQIVSICESPGPVSGDPLLRALFVWGHARTFINHAIGIKRHDMAEAIFTATKEVTARFPPVDLDGIVYDENYGCRRTAQMAWESLSRRIPSPIQRLVGDDAISRWGTRFRHTLVAAQFDRSGGNVSSMDAILTATGFRRASKEADSITLAPPPSGELKARMYARLADGYEMAGRLKEASEAWRAAARLVGLLPPQHESERIGYRPA